MGKNGVTESCYQVSGLPIEGSAGARTTRRSEPPMWEYDGMAWQWEKERKYVLVLPISSLPCLASFSGRRFPISGWVSYERGLAMDMQYYVMLLGKLIFGLRSGGN